MRSLYRSIRNYCDAQLLFHSRVHPLRSFSSAPVRVYVKREDESGFGISGCKRRKYASLLPWLEKNNYKDVVLAGGDNSNHLVSFLQLINEREIKAHILYKESSAPVSGNKMLFSLLAERHVKEAVPRSEWPSVEGYALNLETVRSGKSFWVPEGGSCEAALPGACSIWEDILKNEAETGLRFDHIFIDSGTGLSAGALLCMNQLEAHPREIHVVLVAGKPDWFGARLSLFRDWFSAKLGERPPGLPEPQLYFPVTARSFGSVNQAVRLAVRAYAATEGILTDPVYTAKLFMTARHIIEGSSLTGNVLIIHSGGGTGMMGFEI